MSFVAALLFTLLSFTTAEASFQSGIGIEMALGYPQMTADLGGSEGRYDGLLLETQLILPMLDHNRNFSIDLTVGYRYASYQNTASTASLAEWAQLKGLNTGTRFNFKYFFIGADIMFLQGRHLISGTNSSIIDYSMSPVQAYAGVNMPLGKIISIAARYSQYLAKGQTDIVGQNLKINEQLFMITMQVDLGVGFFNVIKEDSTFEFRDDYTLEE